MTKHRVEASPTSAVYETQISRRVALLGIGVTLASTIGCGASDCLLPEEASRSLVQQAKRRGFGSWELETDAEYVEELLGALQANNIDRARRIKAVQQSLRILTFNMITSRDTATAFELDESGAYLTAKHAFADKGNELIERNAITTINNLQSGEQSLVKGVVLQPDADLAMVFAPTGKQRRPTKSLVLDFEPIPNRSKAWMIGYEPHIETSGDQTYYYVERPGEVDSHAKLPTVNEPRSVSAARLLVRNLIPTGGTSGSPVINGSGAIIGLEAGAYSPGSRSVADYKAAIITPLSFATSLPREEIQLV